MRPFHLRHAGLLAGTTLVLALSPTSAKANDANSSGGANSSAAASGQSPHPEDSPAPIIVVGRMIAGSHDPIAAPVVMQGDDLVRNTRPQIGAMLESLPGVSSSGFAPGVSRPVLRGFDGPRVQVLLDGLTSLDASSVSADHAVSLDTLTVDRVDVLHGPQVLLYAGDPSGGVVNAIDKRIPRRVPDNFATLDAVASYGTAADSVESGAATDIRIAPRLVAHVDGSYSHSNDLKIGGYVLSPGLRAQVLSDAADLLASGDSAGADSLISQANARGRIANSWAKSWNVGGGLAFIDDGGDIGVSVSRLANDYGIPPRPDIAPDYGSISMRQTRADMRAGLNLGGFLKRLEFRGAYGDYQHSELSDGVPATTFLSKGIETRLEAVQADHGGWSGTSGLQYGRRKLDIVGDERLLPDNRTANFAVFTLQRLRLGTVDLEASGRFQRTNVRAVPAGPKLGFSQWSGVLGLAWHPTDALSFSLDVSHGERAPSAEELFIDGVHDATQSYERGNPSFSIERSKGIEGGVQYRSGAVALSLTAYATNFANFITPVPTGEVLEGFPVYQYIQAPARFRGIEAEGKITLAEVGAGQVSLDGGADYVHASLSGIGPVPRIPPLRLRGGLEYDSAALTLRGEVEHYAAQDRVAANEYPVSAFTLVNASARWRPFGKDSPLTLILAGDNLFDVSGRRAASETRDFVPISGRDIRLTAKITM